MNKIKTTNPSADFLRKSFGQKTFNLLNYIILTILALACLLPFLHIVAQSFSSNSAISAGRVGILPKEFTLESFKYVLRRAAFWQSFKVTIIRVILGVPINLFMIVTAAYPLSKDSTKFKARGFYVWILFLTMLFNGGMIPTYLLVRNLHLTNRIWALVLPQAVNVFNMLLVLSFFRQLSDELADAAAIDGASHWTTLWRIFIPISKPVLATVTLFSLVWHWNSWFDGLLYMKIENYPLQTYLRNIIISFNFAKLSPSEQKLLALLNEDGLKSAQMVIGVIPILMVYPYLQKYFVSGITLGSVKG